MVIDYNSLELLEFPVFKLPSNNIHQQDGLIYCDNAVIDDRNQIGDTLGKRRMQTFHKILPLKACYEDLQAFLHAKGPHFIDSKGRVFTYQKTLMTKVVYHKIEKVIYKEVATIIKAEGVNFPIIVKRPPRPGIEWIAMLYYKTRPWLPYTYSEEYCQSLRRKI
jgi:hypothetical protein